MIILKYKSKHGNSDKRKQLLIIILALILLVTIGVTVWKWFFRDSTPILAPDYAPQQTEKNAEPFNVDTDREKLQQQQGGGAVSLTYSREVTIDLSDKNASLMFANPKKSNQDIMIQIVIQDTVVVQSGILLPGYQVTKLDLFDKINLSNGIYEGKFVVFYYQKDTGEKAMINTEIPLTLTVEE